MKNILSMRYRILILLVLGLVLSAATYGFAAANTMPLDTQAGEGQAPVSGYTVTNVVYTLDSTNPGLFASVSFDLDAYASDVYVGIGDGTNIFWTSCGSGTSFTCSLSGSTVSVAAATELHVSSVQ